MFLEEKRSVQEKLAILTEGAKYDVACTSSGVDRKGDRSSLGNSLASGICHSFSSDGRCISLLKILLSNDCVYDCKYCINRSSNDIVRATFSPQEICEIVIEFYRRNYIEGLFLSSGIIQTPDRTMELLFQTVFLLRTTYQFNGYIHLKAIPGADPELIERAGYYADRMSVNLELPTAESLQRLAPNKTRTTILKPMKQIQMQREANKEELVLYQHAKRFVPAGQSTQMVIGASGETDYQLLQVSEALYQKFGLKRVFYSAFVRVNEDAMLPVLPGGPPLLREHRLYQADWLLRFYGFKASEILDEKRSNFNVFLDPKCDWAVRHLDEFPIEINRADYEKLLRVPGIGVKSALQILKARRFGLIQFEDLKKIGVVLKRARYFITCNGKSMVPFSENEDLLVQQMLTRQEQNVMQQYAYGYHQMSLFELQDFQSRMQG